MASRLLPLGLSCWHARRLGRGKGKELLLRGSLVEKLDRLSQRSIVRQIATLCRRVAEGEARHALLEQTIDISGGRVPLLAIDCDALRLKATQELVAPLRLYLEVLVGLLGQLERIVVVGRVKVLLLRG